MAADVLYVEDTSTSEFHASRTASLDDRRDTLVLADAECCQTVCGDSIAADAIGTWSDSEPHGKTARICPACLAEVSP